MTVTLGIPNWMRHPGTGIVSVGRKGTARIQPLDFRLCGLYCHHVHFTPSAKGQGFCCSANHSHHSRLGKHAELASQVTKTLRCEILFLCSSQKKPDFDCAEFTPFSAKFENFLAYFARFCPADSRRPTDHPEHPKRPRPTTQLAQIAINLGHSCT